MNPTFLDTACSKHPKRKRNNGELFKAREGEHHRGQYEKSDLLGNSSFSLKMHLPIEFPFKPWLAMQTLGVDTCIRISCLFAQVWMTFETTIFGARSFAVLQLNPALQGCCCVKLQCCTLAALQGCWAAVA